MATDTYAERRKATLQAAKRELGAIQRDQILDGFAAAIAEKGYIALTVADVARAARVSKTTIYEHFKDKEAIYLALHETIENRILAQLTAISADQRPTGSGRVQFEASITTYLEMIASEPAFLSQIAIEANNATPAMNEARMRAGERFAELIVAASQQAAAQSDEIAPLTQPMALAFQSAVLGLLQRAAPEGPNAVRALTPTLTELLTRLLLRDPSARA